MSKIPQIVVQVGGRNVQRLISMSLRLSMRELADSVTVEIGDDIPLSALSYGDSMAVAIEGRVVLVGEVLSFGKRRPAGSSSLTITGFSSAQRLAKSSIVIGDGVQNRTLNNLSMKQIVSQVVAPFDMVVDVSETSAVVANEPIPRIRIKKNEQAWDFLQRVARRQGCILVSGAASVSPDRKAKASIRITRNAARTSPVPILRPHARTLDIGYELDGRAVHSQIFVKRKGGIGTRDADGTLKGLDGSATDDSVKYSPLVVDAEAGATTAAELQRQAEWEVRKRRAEAFRMTVSMDGWSPNNTQALWWPNTLFRVDDRLEGFDDTMLLTTATLTMDSGGTRADLELLPPDAYAVLEDPSITGGGAGGSGSGGYRTNKEYLRQHSGVVSEIAAASDTVDFDAPKLDLIFKPGPDE